MSNKKITGTTLRDQIAKMVNRKAVYTLASYARLLGVSQEAVKNSLKGAQYSGRLTYAIQGNWVIGKVNAEYYDSYGIL